MTRVKICGIRALDNALMAARAGADLLGLNFYAPSPRSLSWDAARDIALGLRDALGTDCPTLVGVFVNMPADDIRAVMEHVGLDYAQLSGDESADALAKLDGRAFKAIRPRDLESAQADICQLESHFPADASAPSLLVDAFHPNLYGGTGETASLDLALGVRRGVPRLMLAGGLTPGNVAERVKAVRPWGADVASGVEAGQPGTKDEAKTRAFIAAARAAIP